MSTYAFVDLETNVCFTMGTDQTDGRAVAILSQAGALARRGHRVELLVMSPRPVPEPWSQGLAVRHVSGGRLPASTEDQVPFDLMVINDARTVERLPEVPFVFQPHELEVLRAARTGESRPGDLAAQEAALRQAQAVLVPSRAARQVLLTSCRCAPGRVLCAPHGIDASVFAPRARQAARARIGFPQQAQLILCVARLELRKGVHALMGAYDKLATQPHLWIVGDAQDGSDFKVRQDLLRWMHASGFGERVRWLGSRPWRELSYYYSAADAVALPSLMEPFGLPTLEALACGTAVVGFGVDGFLDIVREGDDGLLVPCGDEAALAAAIQRVLTEKDWQAPERRERRVQHARTFGWTECARLLEALVPGAGVSTREEEQPFPEQAATLQAFAGAERV
jgi:glycosyltransferase involved in cell wall biosynthesis